MKRKSLSFLGDELFLRKKATLEFQCPVCRDTVLEPMSTRNATSQRRACFHVFCKDCILKCLESKRECPVCRCALTVGQLVEEGVQERRLAEEQVQCPWEGCKWQGDFGSDGKVLADHAAHCEYNLVDCPNAGRGCVVKIKADALEAHCFNCEFRLIPCDFSPNCQIQANQQASHLCESTFTMEHLRGLNGMIQEHSTRLAEKRETMRVVFQQFASPPRLTYRSTTSGPFRLVVIKSHDDSLICCVTLENSVPGVEKVAYQFGGMHRDGKTGVRLNAGSCDFSNSEGILNLLEIPPECIQSDGSVSVGVVLTWSDWLLRLEPPSTVPLLLST